jgi:hypothetical protein
MLTCGERFVSPGGKGWIVRPSLRSCGAPITKQIMAAAGVSDRRVEAAFAAVRSEAFLGPGP